MSQPAVPEADTPALLVARFLRNHGYTQTLAAFLDESAVSASDASLSPGLTLETLVDAHRRHAASSAFTKTDTTQRTRLWHYPAPARPTPLPIPTPGANILKVLAAQLDLGSSHGSTTSGTERGKRRYVLATTAARRVYVFDVGSMTLRADWMPADSPVLDWRVLAPRYSLGTCMSGLLFVWKNDSATTVCERRDHKKYVVRAAVAPRDGSPHEGTQTFFVVTAGWDHRIFAYLLSLSSDSSTSPTLSEPIAQLELPTLPEDIHLHRTEDSRTILVLARRDSASLFYYTLPDLKVLGSQTLAPHAGPWVPFHPTSLAICHDEPEVLAVTTSSTPATRLLIVQMLIPDADASTDAVSTINHTTSDALAAVDRAQDMSEAQKARRALAKEDACVAAIRTAGSTHAPATAYSTPRAVWRPSKDDTASGGGVWVTGDDGVVRGIETATGKVVARLGGSDGDGNHVVAEQGNVTGHEVDSKVRDLWAGILDVNGTGEAEECVISGGFDRRCILWRIEQAH